MPGGQGSVHWVSDLPELDAIVAEIARLVWPVLQAACAGEYFAPHWRTLRGWE